MKNYKLLLFVIPILFFIAFGCSQKSESKEPKRLSEVYQDYFPIGVAVSPRALKGDEAPLIRSQFASMTPENVMKMGPIHPEEDRYNWGPADEIVEFARANNMLLRGHTLCWHNQTPDWLFQPDSSLTKEELLSRLEAHITAVVSRYKDDIYAWDVVNEVISSKPGEFYRESAWYRICGKEFVSKAFEYARNADPDVELYYNDYDVINPVKRERIHQMIRELMDDKVPIDGVGIQGHWSVYEPTEDQLRATISAFTDLGLKIQITELDVSIYEKEHSARKPMPTDSDVFTEELKKKQADQYEMIFRVLRDYKEHITGVTFWNISDRHSWLDNFPVKGRKDYPLLFDEEFQPKESFYRVVNFDK